MRHGLLILNKRPAPGDVLNLYEVIDDIKSTMTVQEVYEKGGEIIVKFNEDNDEYQLEIKE